MTIGIQAYEELRRQLQEARQLIDALRGGEIDAVATKLDFTLLRAKELESELLQSETNFRESMETSPLGIRIVGTGNETLYANRALLNIYGYDSVEEFEAVSAKRRLTAESYAGHQMRREMRQRGEHVPAKYEIFVVRKDGRIRQLEVLRKEVLWDGATQSQLLYADITEREEVARKLRDSEQKYRTLVENIPERVFVKDRTLTYVSCNRRYAQDLKIQAHEIVGRTDYDFHPRDLAEKYRADDKRILESGREETIEEPWLNDGQPRVAETTKTPVKDDAGNIVGILGIFRDITDRKCAEDALHRSQIALLATLDATDDGILTVDDNGKVMNANRRFQEMWRISPELIEQKNDDVLLAHVLDQLVEPDIFLKKVKQLYSADEVDFDTLRFKDRRIFERYSRPLLLENVIIGRVWSFRDVTGRKRAEEDRQRAAKLESIGTLAGGIAHDFNNVLTGILGNIQLANAYLGQNRTDTAKEMLTEAEKASLRAKALTQQLLTFSKGGEPVKKVMHIGRLIVESATFALRGATVKPEFAVPDNLWEIEVDEGQLNQVISNLLINASHAMPNGGTINVAAGNMVIKKDNAMSLPEGRYVEIAIEDYGIGIPEGNKVRIFEPYFTTKQKGSGLGLATCYSIVKNHGGHITVESELGVGTTFRIYLPASTTPASVKARQEEYGQKVGEGRVLVMDDDDSIRALLSAILNGAGYSVVLAADGAEAIEKYGKAKAAGTPFDAVIMDMTIPGGMGGREAIGELLRIDPLIKAIVSSGYANDPMMAEFQSYGFKGVVTKPYSVREMVNTLQKVLAA